MNLSVISKPVYRNQDQNWTFETILFLFVFSSYCKSGGTMTQFDFITCSRVFLLDVLNQEKTLYVSGTKNINTTGTNILLLNEWISRWINESSPFYSAEPMIPFQITSQRCLLYSLTNRADRKKCLLQHPTIEYLEKLEAKTNFTFFSLFYFTPSPFIPLYPLPFPSIPFPPQSPDCCPCKSKF